MQTPEAQSPEESKQGAFDTALGVLLVPVALIGACLVLPYRSIHRALLHSREHSLRALMKSRQRLISWPEFVRTMRAAGGTCVEEKFSPKGPTRFWFTPENVYQQSPHQIIDWFTMRKGRQYEPFIHWCRTRYTSADSGSALLVDTWGVGRKEIYAFWAECRSASGAARWVEVAPPEILPHRPGA